MSLPSPAEVLRHRPPALLLASVVRVDGDTIRCRTLGPGPWPWPRALEASAQAAGLLAGLQPGGVTNRAVIAEYRDVVIHVAADPGPMEVVARLDRRVLGYWRCRVEAHAGGRLLLEGRVTLAPAPR
jgi:predicted hotdog family 3-hydroxylacyl-ACP dehydratase